MSDRMHGYGFSQLLDIIDAEYARTETIFGVAVKDVGAYSSVDFIGERLDVPMGPAAGPHTQLAENIIAAYAGGCRFFELKTVQTLDGEDLPVAKPCILADDEGYNVEWSTELTVENAYREYVKAWLILKLLSLKFGGDGKGYIFNMSVGYDLKGIKSEKIDSFITGLKHPADNDFYNECLDILCDRYPDFASRLRCDAPHICSSATLSTLHGCPPDEIERIASYLISEKELNTYIKCNPTLLGFDYARQTLDSMGYDYIVFDDTHFKGDLQFADAVPMISRLMALAASKGLTMGVKLTNTFPVDITRNELPGNEMYMSGRSLYPLTTAVAARLSRAFDGKLPISFSGGADAFNIRRIADCGIFPITVATTLLKSGGYSRCAQLADAFKGFLPKAHVDVDMTELLHEDAKRDARHIKPVKPLPVRKLNDELPMFDCFIAPCAYGCPFGQNIPEYIRLVSAGQYFRAIKLITEKNPLPFITGTICAHHCMDKCTRNFYDDAVCIRSLKLCAAKGGYDELMEAAEAPEPIGLRAAVVGGGPAGLSAAYLLGRRGVSVTLFEKSSSLGGVVKNVIPSFRIDDEAIAKDIALVKKYCSDIRLNTPAPTIDALKEEGYDAIILAVGAEKHGTLDIKGNGRIVNAIDFLSAQKRGERTLCGNVVVIGGGNTAMDAARAAVREKDVTGVSIVYRRTKRYMPADAEELSLAAADGVRIFELLAPVSFDNGKLICEKMRLGDSDLRGRRTVLPTGETTAIECSCVVAAVGESVDEEYLRSFGVSLNDDEPGAASNVDCVYRIGDCLRGPATVADAIADAARVTEKLCGKHYFRIPAAARMLYSDALERHGRLCGRRSDCEEESERCLGCQTVCESCVDVCPNRANVAVSIPERAARQILHIDRLCNECGNCKTFCPHVGAPYLDKLTLFENADALMQSKNSGFAVIDAASRTVLTRLCGEVNEISVDDCDDADVRDMMDTVIKKYRELWS